MREDIFFPGEFDLSQFGNQTMPSVIWSTSGVLRVMVTVVVMVMAMVMILIMVRMISGVHNQ